MSEFCHFTDIYSIGQMSEYVLFYGHLSYRLDVYRSDGVTPLKDSTVWNYLLTSMHFKVNKDDIKTFL